MKIDYRVYHCEVVIKDWGGDIGKIEPTHRFHGTLEQVRAWAEEKVKDGSIDNYFGSQKVLGAIIGMTVHEVLDSGHEKQTDWEELEILNGISEQELREICDA